MAGDNWGIVRLGQADGPIGIFDNGVTTFQFLPTGNFNGGDSQSFMPGAVPPTFIWLSQAEPLDVAEIAISTWETRPTIIA